MRALTLVVSLFALHTFAGTVNLTTADNDSAIAAKLNGLMPGDEAIFHAGTYELSARLGLTLVGTQALPIRVHTDGGKVVLHRAGVNQNIVDITNAEFVTLDGIEFSGGSLGVRFLAGHDVVFSHCIIHGTQGTALTVNTPGQTYANFRISQNEMYGTADTAEGMYLGCNNDGCRLQNSIIEGNYVHDTNGPNTQAGYGTGIQLKDGSSGNVLRDNVVRDTGAVCILVDSAVGHGPANVVERNFLYGCGDNGIQASQDAVIRNNIILRTALDGIYVGPHQSGVPQNLSVVHNTLLGPSNVSISVRGPSGAVTVANNALYGGGSAFFANGTVTHITFAGNVGVGAVSGLTGTLGAGSLSADFVAASGAGAPPMNPFPKALGALVGSGSAAQVAVDDFNATPRLGVADVGAYKFSAGGNPGWALTAGFKVPAMATTDGGVPMDAGTMDAGTMDAGTMGSDAGSDAGSSADAGSVSDAGSTSDAGSDPVETGKHGCSTSAAPAALLFALFTLSAAAKRRSRMGAVGAGTR
ncbi:MAG: right-handed parallel beta-helix repeat-containing protein [Archangiaceae bacterium]|nr:right-handed parallel beta-helix repeat-containing protein [Archangiaceae bacterium]